MRWIILFLICLTNTFALDQAQLLKEFDEKIDLAYEKFNDSSAESNLDMFGDATALWEAVKTEQRKVVNKMLLNADYDQWREIIAYNAQINAKVDEIYKANTPVGSSSWNGGMLTALEASSLVCKEIYIMLLPADIKKMWQKIANAKLKMLDQTLSFDNGSLVYVDESYPAYTRRMNGYFHYSNCFEYRGKIHCIVTMDDPKSVNTEFLSLYLCRLDGDELTVLKILDTFLYRTFELDKNILKLTGEKTHSGGVYYSEIDLNQIENNHLEFENLAQKLKYDNTPRDVAQAKKLSLFEIVAIILIGITLLISIITLWRNNKKRGQRK